MSRASVANGQKNHARNDRCDKRLPSVGPERSVRVVARQPVRGHADLLSEISIEVQAHLPISLHLPENVDPVKHKMKHDGRYSQEDGYTCCPRRVRHVADGHPNCSYNDPEREGEAPFDIPP